MMFARKFGLLALSAIVLASTSACGQREPLRSVTDTYCINDRVVTFEPAPTSGMDDPGNQHDTDETVNALLEHNAVHRRLCPKPVVAAPPQT